MYQLDRGLLFDCPEGPSINNSDDKPSDCPNEQTPFFV